MGYAVPKKLKHVGLDLMGWADIIRDRQFCKAWACAMKAFVGDNQPLKLAPAYRARKVAVLHGRISERGALPFAPSHVLGVLASHYQIMDEGGFMTCPPGPQ